MLVKQLITEVPEIEDAINNNFEPMTMRRYNAVMSLINTDTSTSYHYGELEWHDTEIAVFKSENSDSELKPKIRHLHNEAVVQSDRIPVREIEEGYTYTIATLDFIEETQFDN